MAYAAAFEKEFEKEYKLLKEKDSALKKRFFDGGSGRVCGVCHGSDEAFDPASLHCTLCGAMIAQNTHYFVDASLRSIVCCVCFTSLPDAADGDRALLRRAQREVQLAARGHDEARGSVRARGAERGGRGARGSAVGAPAAAE